MSLTITGNRKLSIESGTSKAGNEWKKQTFVLDTGSQYNPEICFQLFGEEKIELLNHYNEGEQIKVSFNLSSKEYNGRYFHNIDAWKIESLGNDSSENVESSTEFNTPLLMMMIYHLNGNQKNSSKAYYLLHSPLRYY